MTQYPLSPNYQLSSSSLNIHNKFKGGVNFKNSSPRKGPFDLKKITYTLQDDSASLTTYLPKNPNNYVNFKKIPKRSLDLHQISIAPPSTLYNPNYKTIQAKSPSCNLIVN